VTLLTSVLSFWIILAGICTEAVLFMTFNLLPEKLAWPIGFFMTTPVCFHCIPMLILFLLSIMGNPKQIPLQIYSTLLALWPPREDYTLTPAGLIRFCWDFIKFLVNAFGFFWKVAFPLAGMFPASNESSSRFARYFLREPCRYWPPLDPQTKKKDNKHPKEKWIYINGINTSKSIADVDREMLYRMFERPIHLVHNPTYTFIGDLLQCFAGKTGILKFGYIEPTDVLKQQLCESLREAERDGIETVVLLAHSQGTIITSNAISELGEDDDILELMKKKLEVYNFANCAHQTPSENVKHLENISNKGDFVAWLGHLFPEILKPFWLDKGGNSISISGKDVIESHNWGHNLYSHYLNQMAVHGQYNESRLVKNYMVDRGVFLSKVFDERYVVA
jgi:hypothetical protein